MRYKAKQKPKKCPKCGSNRMVDILYGYPAPETLHEAEKGEIALGGCCITGDDPKWKCMECEINIYYILT